MEILGVLFDPLVIDAIQTILYAFGLRWARKGK